MGIAGAVLVGIGLLLGKLIKPILPPKPKISETEGPVAHSTGFTSLSVDTTTPVPIVFGSTQVRGNIIKGYRLGENNTRLIGVIAIGEAIGPSTLTGLKIGSLPFERLNDYSSAISDDKSWYRYFDQGQSFSLHIANEGKKSIGVVLEEGGEHITEAYEFFGSAQFLLEYEFQWGKAESVFSIKAEIKAKGASTWHQIDVMNTTYSTKISGDFYPGTKRIDRPYTVTTPGAYLFKFTLTKASNEGSVYIRTINITSDAGTSLSFSAPYCAYILFNLHKTDEFNRLNFFANVSFPFDNPVDALEFLLVNNEFGLNSFLKIDANSFSKARDFCESNNYKIGIAFTNTSYDEAVEMILKSGGLTLLKNAGKFKLVTAERKTSAVRISKDNMLPGSFSIGTTPRQDIPNRLRVRYTDSGQMYNKNDIILEDTDSIIRDGKIREKTLDLSAIVSMPIAQERAEQIYKEERTRVLWCKFEVPLSLSWLEPEEDLIEINSNELGWTIKDNSLFKVVKIEEVGEGLDRFGYAITAEYFHNDIFEKTLSWHEWYEPPPALVKPEFNPTTLKITISNVSSSMIAFGVFNRDENNNFVLKENVDPFLWEEFSRSWPSEDFVYRRNVTVTFKQPNILGIIQYILMGRHDQRPEGSDFVELARIDEGTDTFFVPNVKANVKWQFRVTYMYENQGLNETTHPHDAPNFDYFVPPITNPENYVTWFDQYYRIRHSPDQ